MTAPIALSGFEGVAAMLASIETGEEVPPCSGVACDFCTAHCADDGHDYDAYDAQADARTVTDMFGIRSQGFQMGGHH